MEIKKRMAVSWMTCLLFIVLMVCQTDARLPGFRAKVSDKGINYLNKVAQNVLATELKTLKIPNQSGDEHHLSWSLTNIQNRGVTPPTSSLILTPADNGLTWSLSNLGIRLHADWRVKYRKGFIHISDSGSVDLNVKGTQLKVNIKLGDDGKGRPSARMASCSANIDDVDVKFHGGTAWILNIFRHTIGNKIKDVMKGQICQVAQKEVNVDGAKELSKLKMTVPLLKKFLLDYSLVQAPVVTSSFLETEEKGEVYWLNDSSEAPFSPLPFPPYTDNTKMMYLWISEYIANSLAYVAQKHDYFHYNLTASDLPAANRSYLNTSCSLACVGKLIPQIGKAYPNSVVELRLSMLVMPKVSIRQTNVSCAADIRVDMYAHTPQGTVPFLLSLAMNVTMTAKVSVVNEKVSAKIVDYSLKVSVLKSAVGHVSSTVLNLILNGVVSLGIIPQLNAIAEKGVDLPVTDNVKFENTSVILFNGSFVISTDLQYKSITPTIPLQPQDYQGQDSAPLKFLPEYKIKTQP